MYYSTTKKLGSKNKKNLCRGPNLALGKWGSLPRAWPMALGKEYLKKIKKSLPRAWSMALGKEYLKKIKKSAWRRALGKDWRQWPPWPIRPYLPRARPSAKIYFVEGRFFAEGQALGKGLFAESSWGWPSANRAFAKCPRSSPRQTQKPSAKDGFPVVEGSQHKGSWFIYALLLALRLSCMGLQLQAMQRVTNMAYVVDS